jgi:hypothetical protein
MASTVAESRKHMISERLSRLATTAKDLSNEIDDIPYAQDFAEAAASRIETLAAYVDVTEFADMLDDVASFARRQPGATLALGMVAGLIATQLLRHRPASGRVEDKRGR